MNTPRIEALDPFDLPDWLGVAQVVWEPDGGLRTGHYVPGHLEAPGQSRVECDLLAVDQAYPAPITDDDSRARAHQTWQHGQVLIGTYNHRLTLAVPGSEFDAELVLDALARLAKAVGASAEDWAARLRIGVRR